MKMKLLQIITLIVPIFLYASEKDSLATKTVKVDSTLIGRNSVSQLFQFPELNKKFSLTRNVTITGSPEFSFENIKKEFPQMPDSVVDSRSEAEAGFKHIDSTGKWISSFSNEDIQVLPVGIKHKINEIVSHKTKDAFYITSFYSI